MGFRRGRRDEQAAPRIADRGEPPWHRLGLDEQAVAAYAADSKARHVLSLRRTDKALAEWTYGGDI